MTLVEAPIANHWDPVQISLIQRDIRGGNRATQQRGVQNARLQTRILDHLAATLGLFAALLREVHIHPAGELVGGVPFALAVAQKDQGSVVLFFIAHAFHSAMFGGIPCARSGCWAFISPGLWWILCTFPFSTPPLHPLTPAIVEL